MRRQLTLGVGMDGSREATLKNALSACTVFGLTTEEGQQTIHVMKGQFLSQWGQVYAKYQVPKKDFAALAEAFSNHLA